MHNLHEDANGKVAFLNANTKEKAWHGLGQQLDRPATAAEAIQMGGLDFKVAKAPVQMLLSQPEGKEHLLPEHITVPDKYATYRTDTNTPFGVVGSRYHIVQNTDAFDFFDSIVGEGEAIYETAGALGNGAVIFIAAKMPDYIRVGADNLEKYVFLWSAHDGSGSIKAMFTPIRPVCNNTVIAALRNSSNVVTIRHTANARQKLREAHKIMGMSNRLTQELETVFDNMTKVRISDKRLLKYIEQLFPNTAVQDKAEAEKVSQRLLNIRQDVLRYTHEGPGQDMFEGTLYQAYNGITGYFQNVRNYGSEEVKMTSTLLGGAAAGTMKKALDLALKMK